MENPNCDSWPKHTFGSSRRFLFFVGWFGIYGGSVLSADQQVLQ